MGLHTEDASHQSGPNIELNIKGVVKKWSTGFPNTYHTMQIQKPILALYWLQRSTNLSAFWSLILSASPGDVALGHALH